MDDSFITVVVIDDYPPFRQVVCEILAETPNIKVVGEGGSAQEAIRLARTHRPDILLLDLKMPGGGLTAAWVLSSTYPETKIIALTSSEDEDDIQRAAKSGVCGYILKGVSSQGLIEKIEKVYHGDCFHDISPVHGPGKRTES